MGPDGWALLLLVGVGVLSLTGFWLLLTTSARSAELVGADPDAEPLGRRLLARGDVRLRRTTPGERLETWLRSSGVRFGAIEYLVGIAAATLALWVVGRTFLGPRAALVAAAVLVVAASRAYVERKRAERRDLFIAQLPELARMLSNGTQAGLSIAGAVQLAARELDDPAGAEMRTVLQETRMGRPLDEALEHLRERLPSREVGVLMTTLVIQQRAGGDTVRALQELGATLDARKDLLREIKTLLSGSVFTSYVVAAIGVGTIVLVNFINPGVLRQLTGTAIGIVALTVSGLLWFVAFVLIRATTRVEA